MANSLLTTSKITREAVLLFLNANQLIRNVNRQYDADFGKAGEKIGSQLRIRLPNDYTVTKGPAASVQDTTEQQTVLTMATQAHVDISFTSVEQALSLDDFNDIILDPAMNNLAGQVALDIASVTDQGFVSIPTGPGMAPPAPLTATTGGFCNIAYNVDGSGNLISPNSGTVLDAGAILSNNSARLDKRKIVQSPRTEARLVNSLSGLFNPASRVSSQYESGQMKNALGFDFFMDQTVVNHTSGTMTTATVSAGGQTGYTLAVNAISGTLNVGDIITVAGVNAVNRVNKQTTGELRTFVVTSAVANGGTSIGIYPAIVPAVNGNAVQYQTVTASPLANATVTNLLPNMTYRKNAAYVPEAITMATGDLPLPANVKASRAQYDGVSLRILTQYMVGTDQEITRCDILYGGLAVRPEWGCILADVI
jgi:hypothetical protein